MAVKIQVLFSGCPKYFGLYYNRDLQSTGFITCYLRVCQNNSYRIRSRVTKNKKKTESPPGSGYSH